MAESGIKSYFPSQTVSDVEKLSEEYGLKVGKAIANDTFDKALVAGFAETTKSTGETVQVVVRGLLATSGLDQGDDYYLSASSAGAITKTPPSSASQYVTRIGEAAGSTQLIIKIDPPVLLH